MGTQLRRRLMYLAVGLGVLFVAAVAATLAVIGTTPPGSPSGMQNTYVGFLVIAIWLGFSWALVVAGALAAIWWLLGHPQSSDGQSEDPQTILMRRYALGEIGTEEYERMRDDLAEGEKQRVNPAPR